MALEFALIARIKAAAQPFGQDALQLFHNWMGIFALLLLLAHPILLIIFRYSANCWLYPFASCGNQAMVTTSLSLYALILLIGLSIFHERLRIKYEFWQVTYGLLALFVLIVSLVHIFILGRFTTTPLMQTMWMVYAVIVTFLILWYKILKPILSWNQGWEVVENRRERGDTHTLVLRPVGRDGFSFEPGQYAWIKKGCTPFGVRQHPISLSSVGDVEPGGAISFTIKNLENWSGKVVPNIQPGEKMWGDGPYGVLSADREQGMGYVLIAGGLGIAPLYSMCHTLGECGDVRPVLLFFGARNYDDLIFREELEALKEKMNLQVIYVLSDPDEDWEGERGFITAEILKRYFPKQYQKQYQRFVYFICGPEPLMNAMETILPELGVPREKVFSERFKM